MLRCREKELYDLNTRYCKDEFECVVVYGRRRVGKTALINEFCKGKPTIFFSALNVSPRQNLDALSKVIYEKKYPHTENAPVYKTFDAAFSEIAHMAANERLVFVIDEYPYLAKTNKMAASSLRHSIGHVWKSGKLFLILCGSSVNFMKEQVLGRESLLCGKETALLEVKPLSYKDVTKFNPKLTLKQQALIYGITGGIPYYINKLNVRSNFDKALKDNLFNPSACLFEEPENLLRRELREPAIYNSVISTIAGGASHSSEISAKLGIPAAICAKYLKVLLELGIIKRQTPITEEPRKRSFYAVTDNFFRFWYRFVPQNISAISAGRIDCIYSLAIKKHFPEYMERVFEQMCREYLFRYAGDLPIALSDIGRWWGNDPEEKKGIEIPLVGTPPEGKEYIIGSCKYCGGDPNNDEFERLKRSAKVFGKGEKYHYFIFAKEGFAKELKDCADKGEVKLITLRDMYE